MKTKHKTAVGGSARLDELLPLSRLHPAVCAWAKRRRTAEVWAVAFSGGADSLALLTLLRAHFPQRRLVALHFNHRLRGAESAGDERFCRRVCAALGVRLRVGHWSGDHAGATAAQARSARHAFFQRELKKIGTRALWLAHQQDDVAESIFMRLARGSGAGGLAAPRPLQPMGQGRIHLRPLLTLKKAEITAALRRAGAAWREDSSNARAEHFRNRVRGTVLPGWVRAAGRDALAGAALSRELLEEDDAALQAWSEELAPLGRDRQLPLAGLVGKPRAVVRRAVHNWLLAVRPDTDLSRQGFALLLAAVESGRPTRFSLGAHGFAVISGGRMAFRRR